MRFERLVIEAGENTFSLDFHPRLTVVSGVGRLEREGLVNELVGALAASRSGVHAEILADNGNRFAIFRPHGGRHRVVDVDASVDVSSRFADADGTIDLLAAAGLDLRSARRRLTVTAADLATSTHHDEIVRRLAAVDPHRLWALAERVHSTQERLAAEASASGSAPEDADVVARIEARHDAFEAAQARAERFRRISFAVGALAALVAVPLAMWVTQAAAMVAVIAAAAVTAVSFVQNQKMERARKAEEAALAEAGARSYLGFHLQRVNGLLASEQARQRLLQANDDNRRALAEWHEVAGEVTVEWAVEHRAEIEEAARVRHDMAVFAAAPVEEGDRTAAVAHALVSRLNQVRRCGPGGESLPLLLDEPFTSLDEVDKGPLLELLVRSSINQQVVLLTADPEVAEWARLEAMTGEVTVLEPTPDAERPQATPDGGHVAA